MIQSAGYINSSQAEHVSLWFTCARKDTDLTGKLEFLAKEFVDTCRLIDYYYSF